MIVFSLVMFLASNGFAQSMPEEGHFGRIKVAIGLRSALGLTVEVVRIDERFGSRAGPRDGTRGFAWSLNGPSAMFAGRTLLWG